MAIFAIHVQKLDRTNCKHVYIGVVCFIVCPMQGIAELDRIYIKKSLDVSDVRSFRCPMSELQMAITLQRVIRSTSCLVLGWFFSKYILALFNLTGHELHELYYDRPIATS